MARARNIKPGFYKNEDLAECSIWARYIFPGLWMLADREGRLEDRPKRIKAELLAFDSEDVDPLLDELQARGFLLRYKNSDGSFIQISKFLAHQAPHYSEKPSAIKPPSLPESLLDDETRKHENHRKKGTIKRGSQPPDSLILRFSDSPIQNHHQELPTSTTKPSHPDQPPDSSSSDSAKAGKGEKPLTWLVFEWEQARGKNARSFVGGSEQSKAWHAAGVTEAQLRQAYDLAVAQREADKDPAPINVKFLDLFVAKVLNPREPGSAVTVKAWYESAPGIEAKGKELGVDPPDPLKGGFPAFKARVFEAAGLTTEA